MSRNAVETLRKSFDFIYGELEKDVANCPDALWGAKTGGYLYWQQIAHACGALGFFTGERLQTPYSDDEVRLLKDSQGPPPSKEDILALTAAMRGRAHAFFDSLTDEKLLERNEPRSQRARHEVNNLSALVSLIGHGFYHVGACDALLREHGVRGAM